MFSSEPCAGFFFFAFFQRIHPIHACNKYMWLFNCISLFTIMHLSLFSFSLFQFPSLTSVFKFWCISFVPSYLFLRFCDVKAAVKVTSSVKTFYYIIHNYKNTKPFSTKMYIKIFKTNIRWKIGSSRFYMYNDNLLQLSVFL